MAKMNAVLTLAGGKLAAAARIDAVASDVRTAIFHCIKGNDVSLIVDTMDALGASKASSAAILRGMLSELRAQLKEHVMPCEGGSKRNAAQRDVAEKAAKDAELFARAESFAADFTAAVKADKEAKAKEKGAGAGDKGAGAGAEQVNPITADGTVSRAEYDAMSARAEVAETAAREANNRAEQFESALVAARATIERQAADIAALSAKLAAAESAATAAKAPAKAKAPAAVMAA